MTLETRTEELELTSLPPRDHATVIVDWGETPLIHTRGVKIGLGW